MNTEELNINKINRMRELIKYLRTETKKTAIFEINFWNYENSEPESQCLKYRLWVPDLIHKESESINELIELIPKIEQYINLSKELRS